MSQPRIRVLIVDDSALVRQTLSEVLSGDPAIEVVGTASDPFVAAERIAQQVPDVITLDIEMPRMDGLTFLRKIMNQHPIPVVICSSLAEEGASSTLRALEYGAVDIIAKPRIGTKRFLEESRVLLCQAVKAAAAARITRSRSMASRSNFWASALRTAAAASAPRRKSLRCMAYRTLHTTAPWAGAVTSCLSPSKCSSRWDHRSLTWAGGEIFKAAHWTFTVAGSAARLKTATARSPPSNSLTQISCSPACQARLPCLPDLS